VVFFQPGWKETLNALLVTCLVSKGPRTRILVLLCRSTLLTRVWLRLWHRLLKVRRWLRIVYIRNLLTSSHCFETRRITAYSLLKIINPTGMTEQKRTPRHLTSFKCAAQGHGWVRSRFGVENFMSGTHLQLKGRKTCFLHHHRGSQSLLSSHQFLNYMALQ